MEGQVSEEGDSQVPRLLGEKLGVAVLHSQFPILLATS